MPCAWAVACLGSRCRPITAYNARMSTLTREHMEAIERLQEGATLVLQQLSWNDYEFLLEDLMAAHRHRRVTYDRGRLEVMSPLNKHERFARLIDDLVRAFADRFSITLEKLGETTWRRRTLEQGLEADCCYYVKNADRVIGKELN